MGNMECIDSHNLHQTQTEKTDRKKDMKKSFPKKKVL